MPQSTEVVNAATSIYTCARGVAQRLHPQNARRYIALKVAFIVFPPCTTQLLNHAIETEKKTFNKVTFVLLQLSCTQIWKNIKLIQSHCLCIF